MHLYYIRHAQSINNALWDATGSNKARSHDPELTETGWRQAHILAEFLQCPPPTSGVREENGADVFGFGITHLYCSLMERAVMTGAVVARALGLPLCGWVDLHETGGMFLEDENDVRNAMPGRSRSYFLQNYPELVLPGEVSDDGWWNRPFEEKEDRLPRGQRVLQTLLDMHGDTTDRVAIISHGGFYNYLVAAIMGLTARPPLWFLMNNTAISRFDFGEEETALVYSNYTAHLPDELIT